ncbi:uncharacterized protein PRCAT00000679001 [Priceomyces carsonii]|uniref:uncharacterized protein n=1 Tax=Priceomyces carsonii TaxID=28549 RepID=UPI002EDB5822|nr:unnamed protein product [Priceomyces carsonii]
MRSSIFEGDTSKKPNRDPFKKARSSSPFIGTLNSPRRSAWQLDDLIQSYENSGLLPPILSPTIPEKDELEVKPGAQKALVLANKNEDEDNIPLSELANSQRGEKRESEIKIHQPVPKRASVPSQNSSNKNTSKPQNMTLEKPSGDGGHHSSKVHLDDRHFKEQVPLPLKGLGINLDKASKLKYDIERSPAVVLKAKNEDSSTSSTLAPNSVDKKTVSKRQTMLKLANSAKKMSTQMENSITSLIIGIDSLLLYFMSYDYDDRLKSNQSVPPSSKIWKDLNKDILTLIECINDLMTFEERKYSLDFLKIMRCLLFQTRAVFIKKINTILFKLIQSKIEKSSIEKQDDLIQLQKQVISNEELVIESFRKSKPHFLESTFSTKFPQTWQNRTIRLPAEEQKYYLPLGVYSSLHEVMRLEVAIIDEFTKNFNVKNPQSEIQYMLKSGSF